MSNELFIGALDLSPYLTLVDLESPARWRVTCWNVPEGMCAKLFCNPIIPVPLFLRYYKNGDRDADFAAFPTRINCADFLFLEYAPYTEINFMFKNHGGRFGFHILTKLYLALGEGQ